MIHHRCLLNERCQKIEVELLHLHVQWYGTSQGRGKMRVAPYECSPIPAKCYVSHRQSL